jgi:hypothetical protein
MKYFSHSGISYRRGVGIQVGLSGVIREDIESCDGNCADEVIGASSLILVFTVIGALVGLVLARNGEPILFYSPP